MTLPVVPLDSSNERQHRTVIATVLNELVKVRPPHDLTEAERAAGIRTIDGQYAPGNLRRYGARLNGTTNDTRALTDAIAQCVEDGGAPVFHPGGTLLVTPGIALAVGATFWAIDKRLAIIQPTANSSSIFTDNNTAVTDVQFWRWTFDGVTPGTSNRAVLFDADTASLSERIEFHGCHFKNLFRGVELDRVDVLRFYDCTGEDLDSSVLYVGQTNSTGRSTDVRVRGLRVDGGDVTDGSGGANMEISYADGVTVDDVELNGTGASSGATNLYHGVYIRTCNDSIVTNVRGRNHRRGALVTVFADTGAGESECERITVSKVTANAQQDYAAIRIDSVKGCTISDIVADEGAENGVYLSNISGLTMTNATGRNNNQDDVTGTDKAAFVKLQNIVGATFTNVTGIDDTTAAAGYGQGCLFELNGTNTDCHWKNCYFKFPSTANGYYGIEIASGATLTRGSVEGFSQDGASNVFHETGTATGMSFSQIDMVNTGASDFLTLDQLHKFRCRDVWLSGAAWRYESNGQNVFAWLTNFPSSGNWNRDDTVWRIDSAASSTFGWRCIATHTGGNGGTWKSMGSLAA